MWEVPGLSGDESLHKTHRLAYPHIRTTSVLFGNITSHVTAIVSIPVRVPLQWNRRLLQNAVESAHGLDARTVVAAIPSLHWIPAQKGNRSRTVAGSLSAGGVPGAVLDQSRSVVDRHLHFTPGVIGVDGIAGVIAWAAAFSDSIEDDRATPLPPCSDLELTIRTVEIVV